MKFLKNNLVRFQMVLLVVVVVLATSCSTVAQPATSNEPPAIEVAPADASNHPGYSSAADGRLIKEQLEREAHRTAGSENPSAIDRPATSNIAPIDGRDLKEQLEQEAHRTAGSESRSGVAWGPSYTWDEAIQNRPEMELMRAVDAKALRGVAEGPSYQE